ncbi:uncharacterized protein MELLADRAFT_124485 [Melampsora larici-populina 98AG31]|uniref:Secreted protein n=1 Tax=Melampsora larici-populina (strain 98AG31 / pathotype 3-4-7) TaxID=747676 RepID=F4RI61_MELLP|nr:uncharacterized protein MELLADRAFT_124485 [Melampsora larici-populina 98AG31]EGG07945.1 secreted protein [Melampsora larici-populina 98AG31]
MISKRYLKLLVVFLGLIAIMAPIAEGSPPKRTLNPLAKCGKSNAQCTKGSPLCSGTTPKCSEGGAFKQCPVPITC